MYKVYCDNELIYDPKSEDLSIINPKVDIEVNKAGSFDFIITPNHPSYGKIKKLKSHILVKQDEREIFAGRPADISVDFWNRKKIHCEGELAYLNDSVQRPHEYKGVTVREYLKFLIDNHNAQVDSDKKFEVGAVTVVDSNNYILRYTNWESTLKAISEDLIDSLGGYIFIRNKNGVRYIDYLDDFAHTNTQKIEFGENLLDFSKNFMTTDIATCVIPLGARKENPEIQALGERVTIESVNNGIDSIISPEAVEIYGKITKTITYDDIHVPQNLKRKGEEYLKTVQWEKMILQVKALDLHFLDGKFEQFKLGEYIRVVSKPHGMDANFPLTKMTLKLDKISENTVVLGTKKRLSLSSSSVEASAEIKREIDRLPKRYELLELARDNATSIINQALGGFVVKSENEILIMDTNDTKTAEKVWRWNKNGFGYSKNGYEGTYKTAITMDGGIVADFITLGSLSANIINIESISQDVKDNIRDGLVSTEIYTNFIINDNKFKSNIKKLVDSKVGKEHFETEIKQVEDEINLQAKRTNRNLCLESEISKYGNDLYFKTETLKANVEYRIEFDVITSDNPQVIYVYDNKLDKKKSKLGKNIHKIKYDSEKTSVNIYPCSENGEIKNVQVYRDDGSIIKDEIISSINLTPEDAKIEANKIELTGEVIVNSINNGSTSINGDKIKTGSITTDALYPGQSERIILERGYAPGANNCKSIDANGNAIRLKVSSGTYIRMTKDGEVAMLSHGDPFFAFAPNHYWAVEGSYSGEGKLNLKRAQINCGYVDAMLVSQWSDSKLKENLIKLDSDKDFYYRENKDTKKSRVSKEEILNFVKDCQLYEYTYKNQANQRVSLVTQEVKDKIKDLIVVKQKNESGVFASVDLYSYISLLHVALQDEMKKTEELEKRINKLERSLENGN